MSISNTLIHTENVNNLYEVFLWYLPPQMRWA